MKVTSERLENCEVLLTIEVDEDRVEQAMRKAARKVSREANIPGFRRGKAPYSVVVQMYGQEILLQEALDDLGQEVFEEALEETGIEPFATASVVDIRLSPMVLKMSVPVAPVVDLGDYRALRLDVPSVEVTDEEVEARIEELREENVSWVPVERSAEIGDRITYLLSRVDDESEDESPAPMDSVLEEDSDFPVPGFSEQVVGMAAGESKEFSVTYPDDWGVKEDAGTTHTVHVEVGEVKQKELPPLEELPALVGDYEDLDALKQDIRDNMLKQKQDESDRELLEKAITILVEGAKVEFPKALVDEEVETMLSQQDATLRQQGLDLETYLQLMQQDRDSYAETLRPDATERVKRGLVLGKLIDLEGLTIEADELEQEIADRSVKSDGNVWEEMRTVLSSPDGVEYLTSSMLMGKVYARLLEIVKGEAPELETEEAEDVADAADAADATEPAEAEVKVDSDAGADDDQPPESAVPAADDDYGADAAEIDAEETEA